MPRPKGNVSLFNIEGKPGAIGRIPSYLAHRFRAALVKFDVESDEPVRNEQGFCIRCAPNETGEAIGEVLERRVEFRQADSRATPTRTLPRRKFSAMFSSPAMPGFAPAT